MPIKELQQRFTQVGVIRLGEQRVSNGGKAFPAKLETFRVTSASESIIKAVAALYGGTARPWQSPTGPQFEVITTAREIPVLVPQQRIDPNYELWGKGFQQRMCDGETEQISGRSCLCEPVKAAARAAGRDLRPGEVCKPTTRLSLMLADIQSLGTFKLESHGWNSAAELPMLASAIANAPVPIPARLEIQKREKKLYRPDRPQKDQIESRVFMVPVLHFDIATPAQAFGGRLAAAIDAAQQREVVAQQLAAIGAAPAAEGPAGDGDKLTPADVARLAPRLTSIEALQGLWKDAHKDGALTAETTALLTSRAAVLEKARAGRQQPAEPAPTGDTPPPPPAPAVSVPAGGEVVDVEVEPDKNALWVQIQALAGARKWNAEALERRICDRFNRPSDEMNGFDMETFIAEVESGKIQ